MKIRYCIVLFLLFWLCEKGTSQTMQWEVPDYVLKSYETYGGDDLFFLINGGAELFIEYGFERVEARDFENSLTEKVHVEQYKMNDPKAAWGIYYLRAGKNPIQYIDNYYITYGVGYRMICKSQYYYVISGTECENFDRFIQVFINQVVDRIPVSDEILNNTKSGNYVGFLNGPISLNNIFFMGSICPQGFAGGIYSYQSERLEIELNYLDEKETVQEFNNLIDKFKNSSKYQAVESHTAENFIFTDRNAKELSIWIAEKRIILTIK